MMLNRRPRLTKPNIPPVQNTANRMKLTPLQWGLLLFAVVVLIPVGLHPASPTVLATVLLFLGIRPPALLTRWSNYTGSRPALPVQLERGLRRLGFHPPNLLRRWAHYASLTLVEKAYLEINRALSLLGLTPNAGDTPAERADRLTNVLPAASRPVQRLVTEYQAAKYSPYSADIDAAQKAGGDIRRLSYKAWFGSLFASFQDPTAASRKASRERNRS